MKKTPISQEGGILEEGPNRREAEKSIGAGGDSN